MFLPILALGLNALGQHLQAEGTRYSNNVGAGFQKVVGADVVDAFALTIFDPHVPATGPAAEPPLAAVGLHLHQFQSRDGPGHVARLVVDSVVAAQIARVVVSHAHVHHLYRFDAALLDQLVHKLAVVQHFVLAAKLGVLIAHGVEAVRTNSHHLLHVVFVQCLHVLLGQGLEQVLVAHAPGRVPGASFFLAQDGEVHTGGLEYLDH